jgi:hypothetical protein
VLVTYDPSQVTYGQLLKVFFSVAHNPTELNRQGPDRGTQYRSAIFYVTDEQKEIAKAYIAQLDEAKVFGQPIVTQVNHSNRFTKPRLTIRTTWPSIRMSHTSSSTTSRRLRIFVKSCRSYIRKK